MSSNLKFSPDLFLGSIELERFKSFLDQDGLRKSIIESAVSFGLVDNFSIGDFSNFRVLEGSASSTIKHLSGFAIDNQGRFIVGNESGNISVPNDGNYYWVKISHQYSNLEEGTVSIDSSGNLSGVGTSFTSSLRGQPNIPSRIKFSNSTLNTIEYDVQEVVNDTSAVLQGIFQAESGLRYIIVGSFSPDATPPASDKDIFQYDSVNVQLVQEISVNTPPSSIISGVEFYIARVRVNGGIIEIQDKRNSIFTSKEMYEASYIDRSQSPLIGIEQIRFSHPNSTKEKNKVKIGWGFRSNNWTIDTNNNRLTLSGGSGGLFSGTSDFSDSNFNGWRVYTNDGSYSTVLSSTKAGSQINLILSTLDPSKYSDTSQEIRVVPNAEEIQIFSESVNPTSNLPNQVDTFPIQLSVAEIELLVANTPTSTYNIRYSIRNNKNYSPLTSLPENTVGYYNESSFDSDGVLLAPEDRTRVPYLENESITLTENPNSFTQFSDRVDKGDLIGVNRVTIDNGSPVIQLRVGQSKQTQVLDGNLSLNIDHFVNLSTAGAVDGNRFIIKPEANINSNGFNFRIVQNYVNVGNTGTLLFDFTDHWFTQSAVDNVYIECFFDGTNWTVYPDSSVTQTIIDATVGVSSRVTAIEQGLGRVGQRPIPSSGRFVYTSVETRSDGDRTTLLTIPSSYFQNLPPNRAITGVAEFTRRQAGGQDQQIGADIQYRVGNGAWISAGRPTQLAATFDDEESAVQANIITMSYIIPVSTVPSGNIQIGILWDQLGGSQMVTTDDENIYANYKID